MPEVMTGTNTEKIDQLVQNVADIKATLRLFQWLLGVGFPILIALTGYLVTKVHNLEIEVRVTNTRLDQMEKIQFKSELALHGIQDRLNKLEQKKP